MKGNGLRTTWMGIKITIKNSERSHNKKAQSSPIPIYAVSSTVAFSSHCSYERPLHILFPSLLSISVLGLTLSSPDYSFNNFRFQLICVVSFTVLSNKLCFRSFSEMGNNYKIILNIFNNSGLLCHRRLKMFM